MKLNVMKLKEMIFTVRNNSPVKLNITPCNPSAHSFLQTIPFLFVYENGSLLSFKPASTQPQFQQMADLGLLEMRD